MLPLLWLVLLLFLHCLQICWASTCASKCPTKYTFTYTQWFYHFVFSSIIVWLMYQNDLLNCILFCKYPSAKCLHSIVYCALSLNSLIFINLTILHSELLAELATGLAYLPQFNVYHRGNANDVICINTCAARMMSFKYTIAHIRAYMSIDTYKGKQSATELTK